jgi:hypothetical protein
MGLSTQMIYKFSNGYGASVVQGPFTYGGPEGLWELAVLYFGSNTESTIDYNTPVADGVLGYLSEQGLADALDQIEALSPKDEEAPNE